MSRANRREELARLRPRLMSYAMLRLRNRDLAEDAVQETLVAALQGIERFAGASSLHTWLTGILKHKIADNMRAGTHGEVVEMVAGVLPDSDPEEILARRQFFEALDRSLGRLPARTVSVFVLREVMGMETREVCEQLAISPSNCWVSLHRARRKLRQHSEMRRLAADAI